MNVPIYLDDTSPPSIIPDYVNRSIGRVDFKDLAWTTKKNRRYWRFFHFRKD
ncbi:hypothetical protein D046_1602 [Vibrio parahaemolyticus V-223/04]|nr:hypothetical protein D046_1602 [Vibrio parahaemolyticus V-223/04]